MNPTTDRRENRWTRRAGHGKFSGGGQMTGILLIAIGALYLGANLGWLPEIDFRNLWPLFLVWMGVSDLLRNRGRHFPLFGLALIVVGGVFLFRNLGMLPRDIWRYIWPSMLILWGWAMLLKRRLGFRRQGWQGLGSATTSTNVLNEFVTFGGVRRKVQSQEFEGGSAYATFGGVELDLREAATKKEEIIIEAYAKFGGIEIRVPDTWDVTVNGSGIFGAFEDETNAKTTGGVPRPRLIVTGEAVFGGVNVKN